MRNLEKFFNPKSIAVVGASPRKGKLGNILLQNISSGGWKGKIFCVNPKYAKNKAKKYFSNLNEIKKPVDLILVAIPAPLVGKVVEEGAKANPKIENYVVISSGFKETGKEGEKLEEGLKDLARKRKLNILGPNCLGFINPARNLNATFTQPQFKKTGGGQASGKFEKGKVAIVSQSGALAVALLDWTQNMSVGFSKVISIGNKAVIDESDITSYLSRDKDTEAVAFYLEDIKDGTKFVEEVQKIGKRKPVVVLKAGKNATGQKAIGSHTGSLAQDEAVVEAVLEKINAVSARSIEEFQDLILLLSADKILGKNEIVIITNAGGPGVLASDFVGSSKNLKLLEISPQTKIELKKRLPKSASVRNPIDIIGDAAPDRYKNTLKIIAGRYPRHPILIILTPQSQTDPEKVARIVKNYKSKLPSLMTSFMGGMKIKRAVEYLHENGIANFESPEKSLAAVEKLIKHSARKKEKPAMLFQREIHLKLKSNLVIQKVIKEKRRMLRWNEAARIFKSYGISLAESVSFEKIENINWKRFPFPCVLKTDDPKIVHRWEKKAVALGIESKEELKKAYAKMKKETKAKYFLVQSMARAGLEIILGMKRDENFGPIVIIGGGGTFAEIFKDRTIITSPFSKTEAKRKLKELKIFPILKGFRGEKGYSLDEIARVASALQDIAIENPDISQIDINPAMFYNDNRRFQIVDAKIYLKS